jgi:hypothetical protein
MRTGTMRRHWQTTCLGPPLGKSYQEARPKRCNLRGMTQNSTWCVVGDARGVKKLEVGLRLTGRIARRSFPVTSIRVRGSCTRIPTTNPSAGQEDETRVAATVLLPFLRAKPGKIAVVSGHPCSASGRFRPSCPKRAPRTFRLWIRRVLVRAQEGQSSRGRSAKAGDPVSIPPWPRARFASGSSPGGAIKPRNDLGRLRGFFLRGA